MKNCQMQVPLEEATRQHADEGTPVVISRPESESAKVLKAVADKVLSELGLLSDSTKKQ